MGVLIGAFGLYALNNTLAVVHYHADWLEVMTAR